jgi:hypothetical protein
MAIRHSNSLQQFFALIAKSKQAASDIELVKFL